MSGLRTATPIFLGPVEEVEGGCGRGGVPVSDGAQAGGERGGSRVQTTAALPTFPPFTACARSLYALRTGRALPLWLFVLRKIQRCRGAGACL